MLGENVLENKINLVVVMLVHNISNRETEGRGSSAQGLSGLQIEFKASLSKTVSRNGPKKA